jgi:predicted ATPase
MDNLIINNFRVFKNQSEIQLSPITVLTGRNNSGKSSIIKAFLLFDDYLNCNDQFFLDFSNKNFFKHKINGFSNAINWESDNKTFSFKFKKGDTQLDFEFKNFDENTAILNKFEFEIQEKNIHLCLSKSEGALDVIYLLKFNQNTVDYFNALRTRPRLQVRLKSLYRKLNDSNFEEPEVESDLLVDGLAKKRFLEFKKSIEIEIKNIELEIKQFDDNDFYSPNSKEFEINIEYSDLREGSKSIAEVVGLAITDWFETVRDEQELNIDLNENSSISRKLLTEFRYNRLKNRGEFDTSFSLVYYLRVLMTLKVQHLSPNRTRQERFYIKNQSQTEIENEIAEYSVNNPRNTVIDNATNFLQNWLKKFGLGERIEVEPIEGVFYKVKLYQNNGKKIDLVDLGFGSGQILTILLKISNTISQLKKIKKFYLRYGNKEDITRAVIIIEEPESNLHPQFQSLMAELIAECFKVHKIKFIIETHSEYLIRKLQLLVADTADELKKEDVLIYYMDIENSNSIIKKIYIEDNGILTDKFGTGFFDEAANQALELMTIKNKVKKI